MPPNFTTCFLPFSANTSEGEALRAQYGWRGPIRLIERNNLTLISKEGCHILCGTGAMYYDWIDISGTITTWVLPIIGILLQAPFESNVSRRTTATIARWVGSPIASLSYILWNIKVNAKAALMVDMAVPYDDLPDQDTHFGSMRDSMYLLLAMNQYTVFKTVRHKEAESLLRIVLFSKDLQLLEAGSLSKRRSILVHKLREFRRRSAVPLFISTMWFFFAFALSIQAAFGSFGQNQTAHDLALGCLLAWFPILILGSIVDRNPIAADAIRRKLNVLVDQVRRALLDDENRKRYLATFRGQPEFEELRDRLETLVSSLVDQDFFRDFAGQGRIRWHYGVAHAVLSDIEKCYIAEKGRNWLANESEARTKLVLGPINKDGLVWLDVRELWQVGSSVVIVAASCGGAFSLSFFTPTVGLGCRSGGYLVFFCVALGLLLMEMLVWLMLTPRRNSHSHQLDTNLWQIICKTTQNLFREKVKHRWMNAVANTVASTEDVGRKYLQPLQNRARFASSTTQQPANQKRRTIFDVFKEMNPQEKWGVMLFRPVEAFNACWLIYIVVAQTVGWYRSCSCYTSNWGGGGGYLDFSVQFTVNSPWVVIYWTAGTVLASTATGVSILYITVEWCQQSHLHTEEYDKAMQGLKRTRAYRYWTIHPRHLVRMIARSIHNTLRSISCLLGMPLKERRKTLLWARHQRSAQRAADTHRPPRGSWSLPTVPEIDIALEDWRSDYDRNIEAPSSSIGPPLQVLTAHLDQRVHKNRESLDHEINSHKGEQSSTDCEDVPLLQRNERHNSVGNNSHVQISAKPYSPSDTAPIGLFRRLSVQQEDASPGNSSSVHRPAK